jgi:transposase-like protein
MITREGQVMKMSYNRYPKEMKEAIVARLISGEETVTDIQRKRHRNQHPVQMER